MLKNNATELKNLLEKNEEWLMARILDYAKRQGYSAYTSTLKEAWRLSISGLSASMIEALKRFDGKVPELTSEHDFKGDPATQFGIIEAMRHRKRGVSLQMFLGLMKYYRQSYTDLIKNIRLAASVRDEFELFINRVFDRIEISFCVEWSGARENQGLQELQIRNRLMTNEKNKYLTIFESIPNPIIMLDREMNIDNMNYSAARLFKESLAPGSQYYHLLIEHPSSIEPGKGPDQAGVDSDFFSGVTVSELLPWLKADVEKFHKDELGSAVLEKQVYHNDLELVFRVKFSKSLDISGKFEGTIIILEDITSLKNALTEVKTLRGFLPICSHCKNVRDDEGYWQKVEEYVQDRSEAAFSHSICPDCAKKYYPYLKIYDD